MPKIFSPPFLGFRVGVERGPRFGFFSPFRV